MPFTPYHFGPHLLVGLILFRFLDIPVFLFSNVCVDMQPLLVMFGFLDTPLHGISHTFLGATFIGFVLGIAAIPFKIISVKTYAWFRLTYSVNNFWIVLSGILGAWFHVLTDAPIYNDIDPFYPFFVHPFKESMTYHMVANLCLVCFIPAFFLLWYRIKKDKITDPKK